MTDTHAILLPGGVMPADLAYGSLIEQLGDDVDVRAKDLEVYAADEPPEPYGLEVEVAGLLRFADVAGFSTFHLLGYSAGGAVALAAAASGSERIASLALIEPAWAGNVGLSPEEAGIWRRIGEIMESSDQTELMRAFVEIQLAPGVEGPERPPGPPPPWMALRPAGLRAITAAFQAATLDTDSLRAFDRPVYYALGGRSNPDLYARMGERLGSLFGDFA